MRHLDKRHSIVGDSVVAAIISMLVDVAVSVMNSM